MEKEYAKYLRDLGGKIISSEKANEEIKKARKSVGMTQEELGEILGLRRETISRIENGTITPTSNFLKEFAKTIGAMKVVRDLRALDEFSKMKGQEINPLSPMFLRSCLNISLKNLELIFEIGGRGYQKRRAKILKRVKGV